MRRKLVVFYWVTGNLGSLAAGISVLSLNGEWTVKIDRNTFYFSPI